MNGVGFRCQHIDWSNRVRVQKQLAFEFCRINELISNFSHANQPYFLGIFWLNIFQHLVPVFFFFICRVINSYPWIRWYIILNRLKWKKIYVNIKTKNHAHPFFFFIVSYFNRFDCGQSKQEINWRSIDLQSKNDCGYHIVLSRQISDATKLMWIPRLHYMARIGASAIIVNGMPKFKWLKENVFDGFITRTRPKQRHFNGFHKKKKEKNLCFLFNS